VVGSGVGWCGGDVVVGGGRGGRRRGNVVVWWRVVGAQSTHWRDGVGVGVPFIHKAYDSPPPPILPRVMSRKVPLSSEQGDIPCMHVQVRCAHGGLQTRPLHCSPHCSPQCWGGQHRGAGGRRCWCGAPHGWPRLARPLGLPAQVRPRHRHLQVLAQEDQGPWPYLPTRVLQQQ
jgi:hypothetical protein